jgi:hypothetical protein
MRHRAAACGTLVALVLVAGGCGKESAAPPPASEATGVFAGSDGAGMGLSVDFVGYDATKRGIQAALGSDRYKWSVGIVSIVNRTDALLPVPVLSVTVPDGRHVTLERARLVRSGGEVVPLDDPGPYVPVEGALTAYVLFPGRTEEIRRVRMRVGDRLPVELRAQEPTR